MINNFLEMSNHCKTDTVRNSTDTDRTDIGSHYWGMDMTSDIDPTSDTLSVPIRTLDIWP
jgi:hypothetical protein